MKRLCKLLSLVVVCAVILCACNTGTPSASSVGAASLGGAAPSQTNAVRISAQPVQRQTLNTSLVRQGEMRPVEEEQVKVQFEADVEEILCEVGQQVNEDDPLVLLDDTELQQEVQTQNAYVEIAQNNLALAQATGQPTRNAELQLQVAQRNLAQARANLEYATLKAPLTGTVVMCEAVVGASSRNVILIVADLRKAGLTIYVGSDLVASLAPGTPVTASATVAPGVKLTGQVLEVNPYYVVEGRGYPVKLEINLENTDIQPYGGVEVTVEGSFTEEVLVVPNRAILQDADVSYVFVVNDNNTVSMRNVQTGYSTDEYTVINQGVQEGELVAVSGLRLLQDGAAVEVE